MSPLGGAHLLLPSQALLPHSLAGRAAVFCSTLQYPCIQPCHARAVLPRAAAPQALIVPPRTVIPPGYQVVLENSKMCGGGEPGAPLGCRRRRPPGPRALGPREGPKRGAGVLTERCPSQFAGGGGTRARRRAHAPRRAHRARVRLTASWVGSKHPPTTPPHPGGLLPHLTPNTNHPTPNTCPTPLIVGPCRPAACHPAAEEFYVPGSTHRSWNKEWPVLRILMRQECNPAMAHMGEPTEFEELLDCNAVLQPQHAQQAAQQYQQYTARYAAGAAGAQQQPFAASAPKPWGYFGSYGWPG